MDPPMLPVGQFCREKRQKAEMARYPELISRAKFLGITTKAIQDDTVIFEIKKQSREKR